MTEDEMVGWHHQLNRHEFEETLEDSEGQGSLACCSPWSHEKLDKSDQLNTTTHTDIYINTFFKSYCLRV